MKLFSAKGFPFRGLPRCAEERLGRPAEGALRQSDFLRRMGERPEILLPCGRTAESELT